MSCVGYARAQAKIPFEPISSLLKDGASFCYCAYVLRISGQNLKRKLGVTAHFSEIIELKFGKKLPYILGILTLF